LPTATLFSYKLVRQVEQIRMNLLPRGLRSVIPAPIKRFLRMAHREFVFRRAMRAFVRDPDACAEPEHPVLVDLIYGWGNEDWSALDEYLAACIHHTLRSDGPILECGSGLSTIVVGVVAAKRGKRHWVLEHDPTWAKKVRKALQRFKLDDVVLCEAPLADYGSFHWYKALVESMPAFDLVICDGPPGSTKGGRYGLASVARTRLNAGCTILLDDADREQERDIANRWRTELGASVEVLGSRRTYFRMTVMNRPA
jgi:hypothetical protein